MKKRVLTAMLGAAMAVTLCVAGAAAAPGQPDGGAAPQGLVQRENGFYSYYGEDGQQMEFDYWMSEDGKLYFFNSNGVGVEIAYTWLSDRVVEIFDNMVDSAFIVIGTDKAAVIDGMNGEVDMTRIAPFFTDKPLVAIATHGHGDHIGGLQNFAEIHIHEGDFELFRSHSDGDMRFGMLSYDNYKLETGSTLDYTQVWIREDFLDRNEAVTLIPILDGERFELGGIGVECIHTPGHTAGSTSMLINEDRILITGDSANRYTQVGGAYVDDYLNTLKKLKTRESDYDTIYASHGALTPEKNGAQLTSAAIDELIEGCESILSGANQGVEVAPNAPTRWAYAMGPFGRADGKCGNMMYNTQLLHNPANARTHTVVRGDTLWDLAARYLGSGCRWSELYEANRSIIQNPNRIYVGQVLQIP